MADVEMRGTDGDVRKKGRGFGETDYESVPAGTAGESGSSNVAARSVEGWIIVVTNVHEEASEEDVQDLFADYGKVMNIHLNLDRRTGYVKGYALIEYGQREEAEKAVAAMNGQDFLDQKIHCDFAFNRPPAGYNAREAGRGLQGRNQGGGAGSRRRSVSPQGRV